MYSGLRLYQYTEDDFSNKDFMYSGLRLYQYTEDDFSNKVLVSIASFFKITSLRVNIEKLLIEDFSSPHVNVCIVYPCLVDITNLNRKQSSLY